MDTISLFSELKNVLGKEKVSDNISERLIYSKDVTAIYSKWMNSYEKQPYICDYVVKPNKISDIVRIFEIAVKNKVAITTYGGGSGSVGGVIPIHGGVTVDMSAFNKVIKLDEESLIVEVESGVIGQNLEDFLNAKGLTLCHFPQSMRSGSIGGFIATRSTGQFSTKYGGIEDFVVGLEVVLPNGKVIKASDNPRSSTGPDLNNFFIGSEGILGIITKAILKVYKIPESRIFNCYVYKNIDKGLDCIKEIMQNGLRPPVVRLYNKEESSQKFKKLGFKQKGCLLILCFEGKKILAELENSIADEICIKNSGKKIDSNFGRLWFENRFDTKHLSEKIAETGEICDAIEVSASWSKIKKLYKEIETYFKNRNITLAYHFSHAYTNGISVYNIFFASADDDREAIDLFYQIWNDVMEITLKNEGAISHHHGIGFVKSRMLMRALGEGHGILRKIKKALDPEHIANPGKLVIDNNEYGVIK